MLPTAFFFNNKFKIQKVFVPDKVAFSKNIWWISQSWIWQHCLKAKSLPYVLKNCSNFFCCMNAEFTICEWLQGQSENKEKGVLCKKLIFEWKLLLMKLKYSLSYVHCKKMAENSTGFNFTNLGQDVWKVLAIKVFIKLKDPHIFQFLAEVPFTDIMDKNFTMAV